MHAIFRDGGRQYRVEEGETLFLDYRDAEPGSTLQFSEVLAIEPGSGDFVCGTPLVDGASVEAEVIEEVKGPKVIFHRFRRRKNSHSRKGHRQKYIKVRIGKIAS
ncbi:50S ribosomal protein L21 [bacterium TMED181]|nr:50S ribosomal protein L21 [Planctomycetota bacterium]OUW47631.1 MAG: 50S ribosomal protein L21 [bacterium TMED181]